MRQAAASLLQVGKTLTLNGSRKSISLVSFSPNGIIGIAGSSLKNNAHPLHTSSLRTSAIRFASRTNDFPYKPVDILVELDRAVQLGELFLQQLQVRVDEAQFQRDGFPKLSVRGRSEMKMSVKIGRANWSKENRATILLEEVLRACSQSQLLVDFLIQFAPLVLQLSPASGHARIGTLCKRAL